MSRPGRKRKNGKRHPGGQLVRERGDTAAQVAARMPHRRALGEAALDQRGECELGRLALVGLIADVLALAGFTFAREYGSYLATIGPPRASAGRGAGFDCGGCIGLVDVPDFCLCERRRAKYDSARNALQLAGRGAVHAVSMVVIHDVECPRWAIDPLRDGLRALAWHYGLSGGKRNASRTEAQTWA